VLPYLSPELVFTLFRRAFTDHISTEIPVPRTEEAEQRSLVTITRQGLSAKTSSMAPSRHSLRLDLIEMLRITLSAIDYATKGYRLGSSDVAQQAAAQRGQLECFGARITIVSNRSCDNEKDRACHIALSQCSRAISSALLAACQNAYDISSATVEMIRNCDYQRKESLAQMGDEVLGLFRLFAVAFVNQSCEDLSALLHRIDENTSTSTRLHLHNLSSNSSSPQNTAGTMTIASNLQRIMQDLSSAAGASLGFFECGNSTA
jgi:hypothetical protein